MSEVSVGLLTRGKEMLTYASAVALNRELAMARVRLAMAFLDRAVALNPDFCTADHWIDAQAGALRLMEELKGEGESKAQLLMPFVRAGCSPHGRLKQRTGRRAA